MRLMYWLFCGTEPSEGQVSSGAHVTPMCGTGPSEFIGSGIHVTQPQMPLNPRAGREQLPHSESRDPSMECSAPNPSLPHLLVPVSAVLWLPEHGKYASQVVATPGLEGWLGLGQSSSPPGGSGQLKMPGAWCASPRFRCAQCVDAGQAAAVLQFHGEPDLVPVDSSVPPEAVIRMVTAIGQPAVQHLRSQ